MGLWTWHRAGVAAKQAKRHRREARRRWEAERRSRPTVRVVVTSVVVPIPARPDREALDG